MYGQPVRKRAVLKTLPCRQEWQQFHGAVSNIGMESYRMELFKMQQHAITAIHAKLRPVRRVAVYRQLEKAEVEAKKLKEKLEKAEG